VRLQGWAALALYFGSMYWAIRHFPPRDSVVGLLLWLLIASVLLIAVVVWKGERPVGWRWTSRR
jgi:hypothetical protein